MKDHGEILDYQDEPNAITKVLVKRKVRVRDGDDDRSRDLNDAITVRTLQAKELGSFWMLGKVRSDSPLELPEN